MDSSVSTDAALSPTPHHGRNEEFLIATTTSAPAQHASTTSNAAHATTPTWNTPPGPGSTTETPLDTT